MFFKLYFLFLAYLKRRATKFPSFSRSKCSEIFFLEPIFAKTVDLKISGCTNLIKNMDPWAMDHEPMGCGGAQEGGTRHAAKQVATKATDGEFHFNIDIHT